MGINSTRLSKKFSFSFLHFTQKTQTIRKLKVTYFIVTLIFNRFESLLSLWLHILVGLYSS